MSYPTVLYGPEGEQFNTYSNRRWPLGTRMVQQDGRRYAFALAGGVALVAGQMEQSEVPDPDHDTLAVATAGVVGDRTINITNGTDAIEADLYADGYAITEAVAGSGAGRLLKVDISHVAIGASVAGDIPLAAGYGLPDVLVAGADTITLVKNPYADIIQQPGPPTACVVGVPCADVTACYYCWVQTWGPCAVLVAGTEVIGGRISPTGTVTGTAGAIEASGVIITATAPTVAQMTELVQAGICMEVAPSGDFGVVFLTIS